MTTFAGHFLGPGTHSSRPATTGLPEGTMYVCTTHAKIEKVVSGAWADYATLGSGVTPTTIANDTLWDAKGDLAAASGPDAASRLPVGSNNQVLTADSAQTLGVKWAAAAGVSADGIWDTKGDLAVASAADTAAKLPVGTNGQVLTADSAQTLGIKWTSAVAPMAITTQATTYTLVLADVGTLIETTSATAMVLTVPPNSSVAFPVGTSILVAQNGAGQVTATPGSGVTLRGRNGLKTGGQYALVSLVKRATDEWYVGGDTAT